MDVIDRIWDQLWQVTLIAMIVAVVGVGLRYRWPRLMYGLWALVLVKCLVPPLIQHPLAGVDRHPSEMALPSDSQVPLQQIPLSLLDTDTLDTASIVMTDWGLGEPLVSIDATAVPMQGTAMQGTAMQGTAMQGTAMEQPLSRLRSRSVEQGSISADRWGHLLLPAFWLWITGSLTYWSVLAIRVRRLRHRIVRSSLPLPIWIQELTDSLRDPLSVSQRFQVLISDQVGSPCVIGLVCPTIVIPSRLISGTQARDVMETVLAHELIHLRRRDLWLGGFQNLVLGLWWFHPAIWWASKQLSAQVELLCDQAVIEDLRYKPSLYARRLLSVIESAATDSVAELPRSIAPSMSAFGRTRRRLERIMKIKSERKRIGERMAAVIVIAASWMVLPGDFTSRAQETAAVKEAAPDLRSADSLMPSTLLAVPAEAAPQVTTGIELQTYDYRELVAGMMPDRQLSERAVKQNIEMTLALRMKDWDDNAGPDPEPRMAWIGTMLHLFATDRQHGIAREHHGEGMFAERPQIAITSRFLNSNHVTATKIFSAIGMKWYAVPSSNTQSIPSDSAGVAREISGSIDHRFETFAAAPSQFSRWRASSYHRVSNHLPLLISFLDHNEMKALVTMFQEHPDANLEQAPKVTLFDSQHATVQSAGWRPFVTSVSWNEGEGAKAGIEVVRDGMEFQVMPHLLDREIIGLRFACEQSAIPSVDQIDLPTPIKDTNLQSPQVMTKQFATDITVRVGETALFTWIEPQPRGEIKIRLVALGCEVADYAGKFAQQQKTWALPSDSESVAMQRGLVPLKHFPGPEALVPEKYSPPSPIAREIPWPKQMHDRLQQFGVRVTAAGLTGLQIHDGSAAVLEGESIRIALPDIDPEVLGGQGWVLDSKRVHVAISEDSFQFEFQGPVTIADDSSNENAGDSLNVQADSGRLHYSLEKHDNGDKSSFSLTLKGNVRFSSGSEFQLTGDELELKNHSWMVKGNAELTMETETGTVKRLQAQRIEMNGDFPVLIVERQSTDLSIPIIESR